MMRKKSRQAFTLWHYTVAGLIAIFFYVWQQGFIVNLGYQINNVEKECQELLVENQQLQAKILSLKNVPEMKQKLRTFNLPLLEPKEWNVYYLDLR